MLKIGEYETNGFGVPLGVLIKEINAGDDVPEGLGLEVTGGVLVTGGVPPLPPPPPLPGGGD